MDRDRAADLGVPATVIGRTIRTLLAGEKLGAFEEDGERYDVRVQVLPEYRDTPAKLDLIQIRTASGQLTPITNVADIRLGEGAVRISRQNRSREITIAANAAEGTAQSELAARVEEYGRQIGLAPPNQLVPSGMTVVMRETGLSLLFAFVLAIAAIYMVLASLFNSLVHPITIMMSAPLSFIGAFLALKLADKPLDMMSGIGLLVLMGLVMKNGILLIDYINRLRQDGRSRRQAILEAGPARLRPVLMTAFSLICGLLPVAFSTASGSEARAAIAVLNYGRHGHFDPAHAARRPGHLRSRGLRRRQGDRVESGRLGMDGEPQPPARRAARPGRAAASAPPAPAAEAQASLVAASGSSGRHRVHGRATQRYRPASSKQGRNEQVRPGHASVVIGVDPMNLRARDRIRHQRLVPGRDVPVLLGLHNRGGHVDLAEPWVRVEACERGGSLDHRGRLRRREFLLQCQTPAGILDVLEHPLAHVVPHRLRRHPGRERQQRPERRGGPLRPRSAETGARRAEHETRGPVRMTSPEQLGHRAAHRVADRDHALHAQVIGQRRRVVGAVLQLEGADPSNPPAMAPVIERDDPKAARQGGEARRPVQ